MVNFVVQKQQNDNNENFHLDSLTYGFIFKYFWSTVEFIKT